MSKNKKLFNDIKTTSIKADLKQQPYIAVTIKHTREIKKILYY